MKKTEETAKMYSKEDIEIINAMLKGAPPIEIARFIRVSERSGLDAITRQIYGRVQFNSKPNPDPKGKEKWIKVPEVIIITSIDGFRAIAERTGEYRGQTDQQWLWADTTGGQDLDWHDFFVGRADQYGNPIQLPDAARVGVRRQAPDGAIHLTTGYARFLSFAQYVTDKKEGEDKGQKRLNTFWRRSPELMVSKCAEAQAFRKAFPLLFAGIYIEEEIRDHDEDAETPIAQGTEKQLPEGAKYVEGQGPDTKPTPPPTKTANKPSAPPQPPPKDPAGEEVPWGDDAEPPQEEREADQVTACLRHRIDTISKVEYKGKLMGELTLKELETLVSKWADNPEMAEVISKNPAKKHEAEMARQSLKYRRSQK